MRKKDRERERGEIKKKKEKGKKQDVVRPESFTRDLPRSSASNYSQAGNYFPGGPFFAARTAILTGDATSIEDTSCAAYVVAARGDCGCRRIRSRRQRRRRRRRRCRRCVALRSRLATINRDDRAGKCPQVSGPRYLDDFGAIVYAYTRRVRHASVSERMCVYVRARARQIGRTLCHDA